MVPYDNEATVKQIHLGLSLLENHEYMQNVDIMRDLPRSERRNRRVSNMLNEASHSGRRMHRVDPEATPLNSNYRTIIQNVNSTSNGNNATQNRTTSDRSGDMSGERGSLGNRENTEMTPNVNTNIRDNESPSIDNESPLIILDEGEPEAQQTEDTNRVGENLISAEQTFGNAVEGTMEQSNSSGNEGEGGKREGVKY